MTDQITPKDIENVMMASRQITLKTYLAFEALSTGVPPANAVMMRPDGVPYLSHTWVTEIMNEAFKWAWDYEVDSYHIDPVDGSVAVKGTLTVRFPRPDGSFYPRKITEIGSFEAYQKSRNVDGKQTMLWRDEQKTIPIYTMSTADRIASASSRCFVKCVSRMFSLGIDLANKVPKEEFTDITSWNTLVRYGTRNGLTKEQVKDALLKAGIKSEELLINFQKAYKVVSAAIRGDEMEPMDDESGEEA